jgi:signal transduction histidine kinase
MLADERTTYSHALALPSDLEGLVVAPSRAVAHGLVGFLKGQGVQVQTLIDMDSAFEEALLHPPDVILIDERISPDGGVDLVQRLKGNVRTHFVPVLLTTVTDQRLLRMRALTAGADAVFGPLEDAQERRVRLWSLLRSRALFRRFENRRRSRDVELAERRRWLAAMLHDLQGSLAALSANIEFLGRLGPTDADPRRDDFLESLGDARAAFEQILHSVRTAIDFDRAESGQLSAGKHRCDVGELLRQVLDELQRGSLRDRLVAGALRPSQAALVMGDPEMLARAFRSLLTHLARTNPGTIAVGLVTDGTEVHVDATCPGADLPRGDRARLLEPFGLNEPGRVGHGLALALVRTVVELHDGAIHLADLPPDVGRGFEVRLVLPRATAGPAAFLPPSAR